MRKFLSGILAVALLAGVPAMAQGAALPQGEILAASELAQVEGAWGLIGFPNWTPLGIFNLVSLADISPIGGSVVDFGILNGLLDIVAAFF